MEVREKRETWRLGVLSAALCGVTFAYAVQTAWMTPYLQDLGLSATLTTISWLAGPVSGFLVQPIVGTLSDRCVSAFGRRRPYIVGGATVLVLAQVLLMFAKDIGARLGDDESSNSLRGAISVSIISFWCMDLSANCVQGPIRALLADFAPVEQQSLGSAFMSISVGIGQVLGFLIGSIKWSSTALREVVETSACVDSCANLRASLCIGSVFIIISVSATCLFITEMPLSEATGPQASPFRLVWDGVRSQPVWFERLNVAVLFSWMGWMAWIIFATAWFGENVFGGQPASTCPDSKPSLSCHAYNDGVRFGSRALVGQSIVVSVISPLLPRLVRKTGFRAVYAAGGTIIGLILCSTVLVENRAVAATITALAGVPMAIALSLPYALIGEMTDDATCVGLYMGVNNVYKTIPQFVDALLLGKLVNTAFGGNVAWALFCGGVSSFFSAILSGRLVTRRKLETVPAAELADPAEVSVETPLLVARRMS